ncbi:hypothetical protein QTP88_014664 [Uroleucon formosanum]
MTFWSQTTVQTPHDDPRPSTTHPTTHSPTRSPAAQKPRSPVGGGGAGVLVHSPHAATEVPYNVRVYCIIRRPSHTILSVPSHNTIFVLLSQARMVRSLNLPRILLILIPAHREIH